MILRCPFCHSKFPIEALTEDDAARELLRHAFGGTFPPSLLAYLTLFRTEKRDLAWSRALKLAGEVMELGELLRLEAALAATVESLRAKRDAGDKRPLKDHAYLKRVLEGVPAAGLPDLVPGSGKVVATPRGKTASAMNSLSEWAGNDPIRREIAGGLQALLARRMDNAPGAEIVTMTADVWYLVVEKSGATIAEIDPPRIRRAFERLLEKPGLKWPEPAAMIALLPKRPERQKLEAPGPSEEERARNKEGFRKMREEM